MELTDFMNKYSNREWAYDTTTKTLSFDFKLSSSTMCRMTKWYTWNHTDVFILCANNQNIELINDIGDISHIEISICGEMLTKYISSENIKRYILKNDKSEDPLAFCIIISDQPNISEEYIISILYSLNMFRQIY